MSAYALFDITLKSRRDVSPSLACFTFGGDIEPLTTFAPDQRVKLFFAPDRAAPRLAQRLVGQDDWYAAYRALSDDERPAMRTYTIRAVRRDPVEVDIEFVLHGDSGPATRWATTAQPGDSLSISAPVLGGDLVGFEWKPSPHIDDIVLVADETGLPAAIGIIEELDARPVKPRVRAVFETPLAADRQTLPGWVEALWTSRENGHVARVGQTLIDGVEALNLQTAAQPDAAPAETDPDVDTEIYWLPATLAAEDRLYVWIAAESAVVRDIRRRLVNERGLSKRSVAAMGYWREGRVLE